ncbi:NAD(P)-dependent oxidoreductase [Micromonospora sp. STR1s_5]|nr:NAD(P)-dependent oxidoreductase [Micromonospora sp. STR1s_5]
MTDEIHLGFVGLGQMGAPMAERLLSQGVQLHVHDADAVAMARFEKAGAVAHPSPRSVADSASIVFACLPSGSASEKVAFGPEGISGGSAVRIYAEMSTIGREAVRRIGDSLDGRGIGFVDAPISGGPPAAREGRLAMMVSGAPSYVEAVKPYLAAIGSKVYVLGDQPGQAQIMKLVNNLVMAANMVAASEGLVMGAKAGIEPELMMKVLNAGTGQSASADILARSALPGTFDFGAHLSIVAKDVELAIAEGRALEVGLEAIAGTAKAWASAMAEGRGRDDFTAIIKPIENRGGALVRSHRAPARGSEGTR